MRAKQKEQDGEQLHRNSYGNSYGADSASASASLINLNRNAEIYTLYEAEIGTITKSVSEKLAAAWDEYPHEWFPVAFDEAVRNNARKWAYVEAILKNWKAHGFQSKNGRQKKQDDWIPEEHASEVYN
jgi:DnaD/phage-associated family protein